MRRFARSRLFAMLLAAAAAAPSAPRRVPGSAGGVTLLPNGWKISPAGRHISVGDLPLALVESADGRYVVVSCNGYAKPTLEVVDLESFTVPSRVEVENAWLGLAWNPAGDRLYSSGAPRNGVQELEFRDGSLRAARNVAPADPTKAEANARLDRPPFLGGLSVSPDGSRLYAVDVLGQTLSAVDLESGKVVATAALDAEPYTCLTSRDGSTVFVSLWGGSRVLLFDAATLVPEGEIPVGEHPGAMEVAGDGKRLFVACANTNAVWVVDVAARKAVSQIAVALFPDSPPGATPNALALSPDGRRLAVANADNNAIAIVDVAAEGGRVEGFIPSGWYPTGVRFSRDGTRLFVLSGKGLASQANPRGPQPGVPAAVPGQYVGAMLTGSLSVVPVPDEAALARYTKRVYELTPRFVSPAKPARSSSAAALSRIKHVFYVIRENRTYDQILGDLPTGNGDASLCLFPDEVTPNAHALAREFVLLDNFYVNAEVSYSGHAFSTGAYATDVVQKLWPMNYAGRGGAYLVPDSSEGGALRNPHGNITAAASGYIWDACERAGVSVRSYGEFVFETKEPKSPYAPTVPGLQGRVCSDYPGWDLAVPDNRRVDVWLREFREYEERGGLPALSILRLGNDHTSGTKAGYPTPRAMIAENDLALGRLVEAISHSRFWKESAVFVLEDDAQNGPDHVDAHRSVALIASPYVRRGAVDSNLYTTCGMLHTIEEILGLAPMSQCDAAATPLAAAFSSTGDSRPFIHRANRVSIDEKNLPKAWGAAESARMDFSEADRAPDAALNEVVWRSVRGAEHPMPPPVRAAFVRPRAADPDADGD